MTTTLYFIVHAADGCASEFTSGPFADRPTVEDYYDEVVALTCEGDEPARWIVWQRTARCCGTGEIPLSLHVTEREAKDACAEFCATHRAPRTDSEWSHDDAPDAAWISPVRIEATA